MAEFSSAKINQRENLSHQKLISTKISLVNVSWA